MSKRSKIRWREADQKELARVVKNYNAKLSRVMKNNTDENVILPDRMSIREIKAQVVTRDDLNRVLNSLKRFSEKGSEEIIESKYGAKITKYQKQELTIRNAVINRRRAQQKKELENLQVTSRGKPTGATRLEMDSIVMNSLEHRPFNFESKKPSDMESFIRTTNRMSAQAFHDEGVGLGKEVYIKALENVFGKTDEIEELSEIIRNHPNFMRIYYTETEADVNFIYDPLDQRRKLNIIKAIWTDEELKKK